MPLKYKFVREGKDNDTKFGENKNIIQEDGTWRSMLYVWKLQMERKQKQSFRQNSEKETIRI